MLAEIVLLGKLAFFLVGGLVVITAIDFLNKLLTLLMPLINALAPFFEFAVRTLLSFINAATPIVTQAVQRAYGWLKNTVAAGIIGIIGQYRLMSAQTVSVREDVFIQSADGTLRKKTAMGETEIGQLPDAVREALKRHGTHTVNHSQELLNKVKNRL